MTAGRRIGARARAAATLAACAAALVALSSFAWGRRVDPSAFADRRFTLPPVAWRSLLTVAETADRACPASAPVVVLYVSSTCQHCVAELRRWAALVRTRAPELECVGIVVAAAPGSADPSSAWIPAELTPMLLWDHDRTIAHALDVRMVPLATYVTRKGFANSRVVGEASESSTARHLIELRHTSDPDGAPN